MPQFGPTRTRATWKPRVADADLPFYISNDGANVFLGISGAQASCYEGSYRSRLFVPDYALMDIEGAAEGMASVEDILTPEEAGVELDYKIVGGFETNALRVSWSNTPAAHLRWVALKTFTGVQVKYVQPGKFPPIVFAFADEDAYVYCDRAACVECSFRCKSGFMLYAYFEGKGLVGMPLSRASEKPGEANGITQV